MSLGTFSITLHVDGTATVHGLDFEIGRKRPEVWCYDRGLLVLKVPGGAGWGGVGQPRRSFPSKFVVFSARAIPVGPITADVTVRTEHRMSFPTNRKERS